MDVGSLGVPGIVITVHRAGARYRTDQPGITTWHAFSSGRHYDPDNLSFGRVIACDEHLVVPGAGFARHAHARVDLLTWVLEGSLRHTGRDGERLVSAGQVQRQTAGVGIEHAEVNASDVEPLRFLQFWLQTDDDVPAYALGPAPVRTSAGVLDVLRSGAAVLPTTAYVHVAAGSWTVGGHALGPGDSVRLRDDAVPVDGAGELLVLALTPPG